MYVCACHAVTDRTICKLIESGVCDEAGIARVCGAGSECGGCGPEIRCLLAEYSAALRGEVGSRAATPPAAGPGSSARRPA